MGTIGFVEKKIERYLGLQCHNEITESAFTILNA